MNGKHAVVVALMASLLAATMALLSAHPWLPAAHAGGSTSQVILYAVADATIDSANPTTNYGTAGTLDVQLSLLPTGVYGYRRTLLRFDLSTALRADAVVERAWLELYLLYALDAERLELTAASLAEGWSESGRDGVTWNTRPAEGDTVVSGLWPTSGPLNAYLPPWDITAIVQEWQKDWRRNFGLVLRESQPGYVFARSFASRECEGRACGTARLTVEYSLPGTPTATRTLAPTMTPTPSPTPTQTVFRPTPTLPPTQTPSPTLTSSPTPTQTIFRPTPTLVPTHTPSSTPTALPSPTLTPTPGPTGTFAANAQMDSWVDSGEPAVNHGAEPTLVAGRTGDAFVPRDRMALLYFRVTGLPEHACVHNAIMEMTQLEGEPAHLQMQLEALTDEWQEMKVTWANMPPAVGFGYPVHDVPGHGGLRTWDITDLVQSWLNGDRVNYGLRLRSAVSPAGPVEGLRVFASRESDTPPRLTFDYEVDTTPPTNPTSFHSSHTPIIWSNVTPITVTWSGASDGGGCGVYGYSYLWDHSPSTLPDMTVDTTGNSISYAAADGFWYLHLRTRDKAGNWSPTAANFGLLRIDTTPPESSIHFLFYYQAEDIDLTWSGSDALSGVASYDIQVRDGDGPWTDWVLATTATSGTYHGLRGHVYAFRSRARDSAGNVEAYPSEPDLTVRVGRDLTVTVRDENGAPRSNARVLRNDLYIGQTGVNGTIVVPNCVDNDTLSALYLVHEQPSPKRPGDWSWRVYLTSIPIADDGTPQIYRVTDINFGPDPVLTVRRDQPLIGFHMVFAVEWDAPLSYLEDLAAGAQLASDYVYDYTDGQFFWELIEVADNRVGWGTRNDVRIQLDNRTWPCAGVSGIFQGTNDDWVILAGRVFTGTGSLSESWTEWLPVTMLGHEFGHYGFALYDEYKDAQGGGQTTGCATNFESKPVTSRSSVMYRGNRSSELCSTVDPTHTHNPNTWQHTKNQGETCWQTVLRVYRDSASPPRWILRSPVERGMIVPGPTAIPVKGWRVAVVTDFGPGSCTPFKAYVSQGGKMIPEALLWLQGAHPDLKLGLTDAAGGLTVYGARNGDVLWAQAEKASGHITVYCDQGPVWLELQPNPFDITVNVIPWGFRNLDIRALITPTLASTPFAVVWNRTAQQPVTRTLTYNASLGRYTGSVYVDPSLSDQGHLRVQATDTHNRTVVKLVPFRIDKPTEGYPSELRSEDGMLELTLPADALSGGPWVSIHEATVDGAGSQGLVRVGPAYEILVSTGQSALNGTGHLHMYYPPGLTGVLTPTLGIYRWDETGGRWEPLDSRVNGGLYLVSAPVNQLSVFALLGEPAPEGQAIYLPIVIKRR